MKTPEERQRRLEETLEIHADPNMDPSYESEEDEDEGGDKRQGPFQHVMKLLILNFLVQLSFDDYCKNDIAFNSCRKLH